MTLRQRHVVRLETRPPNIEGKGAVKQRQLVINALRMRPDRIIVGEVRGDEALDMLQAMNTGHDGSLTTVHANSARDALYRLDTMVAMANLNIPERAIRQQIASAVNLVVHMSRLADGTRKVTSITEITGMEGDVDLDAGHLRVRAHGHQPAGQGVRAVPGHRHPAAGAASGLQTAGVQPADRHVRAREGQWRRRGAAVLLPFCHLRRWLSHRPRRLLALVDAPRASDGAALQQAACAAEAPARRRTRVRVQRRPSG